TAAVAPRSAYHRAAASASSTASSRISRSRATAGRCVDAPTRLGPGNSLRGARVDPIEPRSNLCRPCSLRGLVYVTRGFGSTRPRALRAPRQKVAAPLPAVVLRPSRRGYFTASARSTASLREVQRCERKIRQTPALAVGVMTVLRVLTERSRRRPSTSSTGDG